MLGTGGHVRCSVEPLFVSSLHWPSGLGGRGAMVSMALVLEDLLPAKPSPSPSDVADVALLLGPLPSRSFDDGAAEGGKPYF